MSFTELTFHLEMSWLNLDASPNMVPISVTELTSHFEMSWLKLYAL